MDKLTVSEIYTSVQGESSYTGFPCVFVRLTGCPLRCRWCDTAYAFTGGKETGIDEVFEAVIAHGIDLVELTGGEPLAQKHTPALIQQLLDAGKTVLIELFQNGGDPAQIVKEKNLAQVSDEGFILEVVTKILNDNPKEVEQFLAGKETIMQWFMGQIARTTKGKADPNIAKELLVKLLEERRK